MEICLDRNSTHVRRSRAAAGSLCGLLACAALLFGARPAAAQVQIELTLARRTYMLYEPLVATVTLTNQAGRDITFEDTGGKPWFNVEVTTLDGQVIQPYDTRYKLNPLTVPAGETRKRKIDLNPLFPIRELGSHRLRANVYLADADKYFGSAYTTFDIAEGQLIWRQDVGVPGSTASVRQVSLLTFQRPDRLELYARVRDGEGGNTVYATHPLGRVLSNGTQPQAVFDRANTLHVLQEAMPSAYLYTQISVDGEWLNQQAYNKVGSNRPRLEKSPSGDVELHGGKLQVAETPTAANSAVREPKLSDRPTGLPGSGKKPDGQ